MLNMYTSCREVCGQDKHCGNRYCSLHPSYYGPKTKKVNKDRKPYSRKRPTSPRNNYRKY